MKNNELLFKFFSNFLYFNLKKAQVEKKKKKKNANVNKCCNKKKKGDRRDH